MIMSQETSLFLAHQKTYEDRGWMESASFKVNIVNPASPQLGDAFLLCYFKLYM